MRLLVIGIGNPTPSFIKRRLLALEQEGVSLSIVAEYGQSMDDYKTKSIIRIGGSPTINDWLSSIVLMAIHFGQFFRLISIRSDVSLFSRVKWAVKYFPLTRIKEVDVVHFQWLSYLPEFAWLRKFFMCPFVGSARGSQITIYPHTRDGYKSIMQDAIGLADYIHCVSTSMKLACLELGALEDKLFVNHNGIPLERYEAKKNHQHDGSELVLVSVGSLIWRKGYWYQLQMIRRLASEGRHVKLILVGDGPDMEGLKYTSKILGLDSMVMFVGKVESSEVAGWLNQADVYLSTSVAEGLSNSMVEASACSLPILAFKCEGVDEVIFEGRNGYIVPFGEVDQMTEKLIFLMNNRDICKAMGKASRAIAEERFSQTDHVNKMIQFYARIRNSQER